MPRMQAVNRQTNCGFSLLELMVVIVIVALLFTFVSLAIRTPAPEDTIKTEAHRFNRLLQLLLEEAVLKGEDYGIEFGATEYRFTRLENNDWVVIADDRILRLRELPPDMELDLSLEQTDVVIEQFNQEDKDNKTSPQVFILSSGEITPEFTVHFYIPAITTRYSVHDTFDGKHVAKLEL